MITIHGGGFGGKQPFFNQFSHKVDLTIAHHAPHARIVGSDNCITINPIDPARSLAIPQDGEAHKLLAKAWVALVDKLYRYSKEHPGMEMRAQSLFTPPMNAEDPRNLSPADKLALHSGRRTHHNPSSKTTQPHHAAAITMKVPHDMNPALLIATAEEKIKEVSNMSYEELMQYHATFPLSIMAPRDIPPPRK